MICECALMQKLGIGEITLIVLQDVWKQNFEHMNKWKHDDKISYRKIIRKKKVLRVGPPTRW
jgi:hypothetical protein